MMSYPPRAMRPDSPSPARWKTWAFRAGFVLILAVQAAICFQGLADSWTRGHNGWNGSAYHLSARNTLRWGDLFPVQYYTGRTPPDPGDYYTHHPIGMHLHNVASLWLFGDSEASARAVPALFGVLALASLMVFARRFHGPGTALLTGAVYAALPINGIFANMMNHSSGFIFWAFLGAGFYVRFQQERERVWAGEARAPWRRQLAGLLVATFFSTLWDWPAYYIAFATGLHWLALGLVRQRRAGRPMLRLEGDLRPLAIYSATVVGCLGLHLLLVVATVGHFGELSQTVSARLSVTWDRFLYTLKVVPELMFTAPVLLLTLAGFVLAVVRLFRGRMDYRDVIPLGFFVGGVVHFFVFKWSTIVHEYWLWTTMPFVAIACATTVIALGRWLSRVVPAALSRDRKSVV